MRRRRMERRPQRQRRLSKPVISVGNLSMGGTGKTPVVAAIAQWLIGAGHRPSILTQRLRPRGCGGRRGRDRSRRPLVGQAGDEPMMLARQVPGATVCVSPDRYLGGVLAEKLGCTVHVLDDGFQHIELARDLDILVTTIGEIPNGRVIPRRPLARAEGCSGARAFPGRDGCDGRGSERGGVGARNLAVVRMRAEARRAGRIGIRDQGSGIRDRDQKCWRLPGSPIPSGSSPHCARRDTTSSIR